MTKPEVPTARDVMTRTLITLSPETPLFEAISKLLDNDISGAPVVDESGRLLGLFSEFDCLRELASGEFYEHGNYAVRRVSDLMTGFQHTVPPDLDLYGIAHEFMKHRVRRLPVIEDGRLIGQISRRDMLRLVRDNRDSRRPGKGYPDYPKDRTPA
jgi:CBS domain-containing protein